MKERAAAGSGQSRVIVHSCPLVSRRPQQIAVVRGTTYYGLWLWRFATAPKGVGGAKQEGEGLARRHRDGACREAVPHCELLSRGKLHAALRSSGRLGAREIAR